MFGFVARAVAVYACSHEEGIFFPWMKQRVELPPRFAADHDTLMMVLQQCDVAVKALGPVSGDAAQDVQLMEAFVVSTVQSSGCPCMCWTMNSC